MLSNGRVFDYKPTLLPVSVLQSGSSRTEPVTSGGFFLRLSVNLIETIPEVLSFFRYLEAIHVLVTLLVFVAPHGSIVMTAVKVHLN